MVLEGMVEGIRPGRPHEYQLPSLTWKIERSGMTVWMVMGESEEPLFWKHVGVLYASLVLTGTT